MPDSEYISYLSTVLLKAEKAKLAGMAALAFQVEARAKTNIQTNGQIDTGFMLNSTYAMTRKPGGGEDSGYARAKGQAQGATVSRKTGEAIDHRDDMAPEASLGSAEAAVVVGAAYAVYQEAAQSFLFRAGEQVSAEVNGLGLEGIFTEVMRD